VFAPIAPRILKQKSIRKSIIYIHYSALSPPADASYMQGTRKHIYSIHKTDYADFRMLAKTFYLQMI